MQRSFKFLLQRSTVAALSLILFSSGLAIAPPVLAHPENGLMLPINTVDGLVSGVLHLLASFEHLAFIVTIGFLCCRQLRGGWVPISFVLAGIVGTLVPLHDGLAPSREVAIACSVMILGVMLVATRFSSFVLLAVLGAIAGLLHGYALGGVIAQAPVSVSAAYLMGFGVIQAAIALLALLLGRLISEFQPHRFTAWMQWMGIGICTIGTVSLKAALWG